MVFICLFKADAISTKSLPWNPSIRTAGRSKIASNIYAIDWKITCLHDNINIFDGITYFNTSEDNKPHGNTKDSNGINIVPIIERHHKTMLTHNSMQKIS